MTNEVKQDAVENYFEFRDVYKSFDDRPVLIDVSFKVKRGETCVIMGRSGVGKSVSLKLLLGFLQPDSGQIIVAGKDVTNWTEEQFSQIRRHLHAHPELSGQEFATTAYLSKRLAAAQIPHRVAPDKRGI